MRPHVFLGDLVRAELALRPDPDTVAAIGALLGLAPVAAVREQARSPADGGDATGDLAAHRSS